MAAPGQFLVQSADAIAAMGGLLSFLYVLPIPARAVEGWFDLLRRRPVMGGEVFDLQLVATMIANGVLRIYTFNTADFEAFKELIVSTPRQRVNLGDGAPSP